MSDYLYNNEIDIRLSLFFSAFVLLAICERQWPKRQLTKNKIKRWLNNIALVFTGTLLVRVLLPVAAVGSAYLAEKHHLGFANHFDMPLWLEVTVMLVLLDLSIYFQHTIFHVLPIMWRFHRVHHSDLDMDISTGLRFHPVEILISLLIKMIIIVGWGAPVLAVIIFEIVLNFMSMFTHANVRLNEKFERVLRWFIVTPDMHRVHHSVKENETNSNFSFNISLWDRIFGTYKESPEFGHLGMELGLDQCREEHWQNYLGMLKIPFLKGVKGYAINYRDTKNARELAFAKELALKNEEQAMLATELEGYLQAVGHYALVSVADVSGKIISVNDRFCQISGYKQDELIGKDHRLINSGVHEKSFFDDMWNTISNGHDWQGEVCNRAKNGELYWVDSAIVPIKNSDGSIKEYVSVRVDISQRKRYELGIEKVNQELTHANMELETLSQIDALTGIANRRQFDEVMSSYMSTMSRSGVSLTLILCDVDYFKNYNDLYGHTAGDECLRNIAKSIDLTFSRVGDVVARYGGEEFAVILPNIEKETAMMLAERLRSNIQQLALAHTNSSVADVVTVSVGVVSLRPDKNMSVDDIVTQADKALYRAKEIGRNRIEIVN